MDCCNNAKKEDREKIGLAKFTTPRNLLIICLLGAGFLFVVVFFLKIPIGNILTLAVFLACPLMHIFMMKNHDSHKH